MFIGGFTEADGGSFVIKEMAVYDRILSADEIAKQGNIGEAE